MTAADALDLLTSSDPPAALPKLDGLDFRPAAVGPAAVARDPEPVWWDVRYGRVVARAPALKNVSLRSANLAGVAFERADFTDADLAEITLTGAMLGGAVFDGALLEEADLRDTHLRFATFREAVLEGAKLQGADLWGAKLAEADADRADFRDTQLEEADFRTADARDADFRGARLGLTDFRGADLRGADFRGTHPRAAKFDGADLRRVNLEHLDLSSCSLTHAWLSDARLDRTRFHREQLGPAIGEEVAGEYELARRGYLSLERNFEDVGDPDAASWAYRRRRRMGALETRRRARAALRGGRVAAGVVLLLSYGNLKLVELVCDYGESVSRVLLTYLVLIVVFGAGYGVTDAVVREAGDPARPRQVTRSAVDLAQYSLTAMIAPGNPPEGLHPANEVAQLATLVQSFAGVFLTGLLGFVTGNRIRR